MVTRLALGPLIVGAGCVAWAIQVGPATVR